MSVCEGGIGGLVGWVDVKKSLPESLFKTLM